MSAKVVYDNAPKGADIDGTLFKNKKFWVAQRIPMRSHFLHLIKINGGEIVPLEKKAHYLIADHARKDAPVGSISYQFIESSIDKGELTNPADYPAGPSAGTIREVGSAIPSKGSRKAYTEEDDRVVCQWVHDCVRRGESCTGNAIYKRLEQENNRHPWQSWRDRYLKQLQHRASTYITDNAPPSPLSEQSIESLSSKRTRSKQTLTPSKPVKKQKTVETPKYIHSDPHPSTKSSNPSENYTVDDFDRMFDKEDWEELYANADLIKEASVGTYLSSWERWAAGTPQTGDQWRQYFEKVVLPQWERDGQFKKDRVKARVHKRHEDKQRKNPYAASQEMSRLYQEEAGEDDDDTTSQSVEGAEGKANATSSPPVIENTKAERRPPSPSTSKPVGVNHLDLLVEQFLVEHRGKRPLSAFEFYVTDRMTTVQSEQTRMNQADIQKMLQTEWDGLSRREQRRFVVMEAADKSRFETETQQSQLDSQEQSDYEAIEDEKVEPERLEEEASKEQSQGLSPKRVRNLDHNFQEEIDPEHPPLKKRRMWDDQHLPEDEPRELPEAIAEEEKIRFSQEPSSASEDEEESSQPGQNDSGIQAQLQNRTSNKDSDSVDGHIERAVSPNSPLRVLGARSVWDTQAILSSPAESVNFSALPPPPPGFTQTQNGSGSSTPQPALSPPLKRGLISTTNSIHEFRDSLTKADLERERSSSPMYRHEPLPPLDPDSEAASESSNGQVGNHEDTDIPLTMEEMPKFFAELNQRGYVDSEIIAALKCTNLRPELAAYVLEEKRAGRPLPNQQGIWSEQDDKDLESADARKLQPLEKKHTWDKPGGMVEREKFLQRMR